MSAAGRWQQALRAAADAGLIGRAPDAPKRRTWAATALVLALAVAIALPALALLSMVVSALAFGTRPYLGVGALLIGATLAPLRASAYRPALMQMLLIVGLAAGIVLCAEALAAELPFAVALLATAALCLMLAWMTPVTWFQSLLACAAGLLLVHAISLAEWRFSPQLPWLYGLWSSLYLLLVPLTALIAFAWQRRAVRRAHWLFAMRFEGPMRGWTLAALLSLAASAGPSVFAGGMFVGGAFAPSFAAGVRSWGQHVLWWPPSWLALLVLAASWLGARRRWPWLASPPVTALLIVASLIAWLLQPALAPALALALVAAATGRRSLALVALAACLWILGALLALLPLPLAARAGILALAAVVAAALGGRPVTPLHVWRERFRACVQRSRRERRPATALLVAAALATLAIVNLGAWWNA